jgi:hypothetical protein
MSASLLKRPFQDIPFRKRHSLRGQLSASLFELAFLGGTWLFSLLGLVLTLGSSSALSSSVFHRLIAAFSYQLCLVGATNPLHCILLSACDKLGIYKAFTFRSHRLGVPTGLLNSAVSLERIQALEYHSQRAHFHGNPLFQ